MLADDGGVSNAPQVDAGSAEACARGATEACTCANGGSGWRVCEQSASSPLFGFLGECSECTFKDAESPDASAPGDGAEHCGDGTINGGETDVDCGGPCVGCPGGASCASATDCSSGSCDGASCRDGTLTFRNFDHTRYDYPNAVDWSCPGTTRFDSTGEGAFVQTTSCSNQADQRPAFTCGVEQTASGGPPVCILRARGLSLGAEHLFEIVGDKPVILAVQGDASILGSISADALGVLPGPGGNLLCEGSQGGDGEGNVARLSGASGGGGGGFASPGGVGGSADTDGTPRTGGAGGGTRGESTASPLLGGCPGGRAGGCTGEPGAGGGAIQLAATGRLTIRGAIHADGGLGTTPCGMVDEGGGTGGGSGGTVLVQAAQLDVAEASLRARGGSGGQSGTYAGAYTCGGSSGGAGAESEAAPGGDGVPCQGGGSGGGGGYGRVVVD